MCGCMSHWRKFLLSVVLLSDALRRYHEVNAALPKYVVVYRDGVGDGQVLTVQQHEVPQVRESMRSLAPEWVTETLRCTHTAVLSCHKNPVLQYSRCGRISTDLETSDGSGERRITDENLGKVRETFWFWTIALANLQDIAGLPSLGRDSSPPLTFCLWYSHICAESGH